MVRTVMCHEGGVGVRCSMRHHIDLLLLEIWRDPAQKRALTQLAQQAAAAQSGGAQGGLLVDYARALLNSLMYMLGVRAPGDIITDYQ